MMSKLKGRLGWGLCKHSFFLSSLLPYSAYERLIPLSLYIPPLHSQSTASQSVLGNSSISCINLSWNEQGQQYFLGSTYKSSLQTEKCKKTHCSFKLTWTVSVGGIVVSIVAFQIDMNRIIWTYVATSVKNYLLFIYKAELSKMYSGYIIGSILTLKGIVDNKRR